MRLLLQHRTHYGYDRPAALGPHTVRLRPAGHAKAKIETYALHVEQPSRLQWQQDPAGNHIARVSFAAGQRVSSFDLLVEMAIDIRPVNPFDFFIDSRCEEMPFEYPPELMRDLAPYLDTHDPAFATGPLFASFLAGVPKTKKTVDRFVGMNQAVHDRLRYVIREESGVWTPEQTLAEGRGSCRDSAVLLIAALRASGLAARFASGYLVQITDEGMIPDQPKGVTRDVVDLHAWAEVYVLGGGWIGLDATSGLLCGEGHIPLACTARPETASPTQGTSDVPAKEVSFSMSVGRLGHEPRPTAPFPEETWTELLAAGDRTDASLAAQGIALTVGGEPTFTSRLHPEAPEWNGEAMGATKWEQGVTLTEALRARLAPGGVILHRYGKLYPGESLPRWALDIVGRRDGAPLMKSRGPLTRGKATVADARRFIDALADALEVSKGDVLTAYEDPWYQVREEARLPEGVDPLRADVRDSEERRRLARLLDRGLATEVGFVLPLSSETAGTSETFKSHPWSFRRERLYLVPGESPVGLRLPLDSIEGAAPPLPEEEEYTPPDPRRAEPEDDASQPVIAEPTPAPPPPRHGVRTALCVEPRDGRLFVFLPPLAKAARFADLIQVIDETSLALDLRVALEGYPPAKSPDFVQVAITPDPGVLEVNIPPTSTSREHVALMEKVFDAALHAGLCAEKYQLDGRQSGSGGGNHVTMGGASALASPFVKRPDLLASLITFTQHHPSLSFLFTGLFVGPTSQAPRVDEARHDALYELEIALDRAFKPDPTNEPSPPWLCDALFRHLLVDVSGNTHRAEICIDKLFDPVTPHGRQGIVELRAFEMPPHVRMTVAQVALVRALVASFGRTPYHAPLVRWGQVLHDRFLLPTWLWRDFEDVLAHLDRAGVPLPSEAYRAFLEHRFPIVGALQAGEVHLELRNAIEPWNVLGEEMTGTGTSRFVDSSMERVEVRAEGIIPERHVVTVNGYALPMRATGAAGERVGGVRFRAWAPPHSLHPHLGIHHPLRFDVVDTWAKRSLGACGYHVWHPEGRGYGKLPLTRFEASARRAQRFTIEGPSAYPATFQPTTASPDAPYTLDLRRFPLDHPVPEQQEESRVEST